MSNLVRPIRTLHFEKYTDRIAECPTTSPCFSKKTPKFEEMSVTRNANTELNPRLLSQTTSCDVASNARSAPAPGRALRVRADQPGRAVQVDPVKPS